MFNAIRTVAAKYGQKLAVAAPLLLAGIAAHAQEAEFTAAQTTLTGNIGTYGAGLVALSVVGVGFGVAVKYIKKLRGAS